MVGIRYEPVPERMSWIGANLEQTDEWIDVLSEAELAELREAARRLPEDPARWPELEREDLELPTLGPRIEHLAEELEHGRGFALMRGVDVDGSEEDVRRRYWVIGTHFGRMVAQNGRGDLIGEVTDRGGKYGDDPHARGYTSNAEMRFHADGADVVALLCLRPAASGGKTAIVSTMTMYNCILQEAPHILPTLYRGFRYYIRLSENASGEGERGRIGPVRDAMYIYHRGRLSGGLNFQSVRSLPLVTGEPLPAQEVEALDTVESIAERPRLALEFMLRRGDLVLVNNYMVLHKRTRFGDSGGPNQKRLLLRLWLNLHGGRPLPEGSAKALNRWGFSRPAGG